MSRRIRHNKTGSFSATVVRIGIITVAVAAAVAIITFAVLFGFKETIEKKVFLFVGQLRVSGSLGVNDLYNESALPKATPLARALPTMPNLDHWQMVAYKSGVLKTTDELKGVVFKGVGSDYNWSLFKEFIQTGRPPKVKELSNDSTYSSEILISRRIANQLSLGVGDKILMYFVQDPPRVRNLSIVGIYEAGLVEEFDDKLILGDIRLVQRLNNWGPDSVGSYEIFLKDFKRIDQSADWVFDAMTPEMFLLKVTDTYRLLFDWLLLLDTNTTVLITLIIFVVSFNIISVLLIMIMERTDFIGLLKTLGSSNTQIRSIFVRLGLNIILRGLLIGNLFGLGICWLQQKFELVPLDPVNYFMNTVPISIHWDTVLLINLCAVVIIGVMLLAPAYIIARIAPVRALLFRK